MNILILSNSAPNYCHFFNQLASRFASNGSNIFIAVDSKFSRRENSIDQLGCVIYEFSAYHSKHRTNNQILEKYAAYNLNLALHSDFERAEVYNIWNWKTIDNDFYDKLKSALLSYFENIIQNHKIDVIIYENVSNSFSHFALFAAKENNIEYIGIGGSRLPGRFSITKDPLKDDETATIFSKIQSKQIVISQELREWASDYILRIETIVPDYMALNGLDRINLFKRYFKKDRAKKVINLIKYAFNKKNEAFQIGNPLITHINLFKRNIKRILTIRFIKKIYQKPQPNEQFFLYPIHFHPESSTSILASSYINEYEVIRNIAFNLPEGIKLYVKDHASAWGYPSRKFYSRVRRLPNVCILGPYEKTKQLIKSSLGVITLSSTVGYEALLLRKRVYLLGTVFYEFHKGVIKVENFQRLRENINFYLKKPIDWDEEYNSDFVCAYYKATLPGVLNLMETKRKAKHNANNIFNELEKKLEEITSEHQNSQ